MSVAGKAVGDPTAARAFQPVSQVNPTTGAPSGSASTTDGSMPISGADGTSKSSLTNPVATLAEVQFNTTRPTITSGGYAPWQGTNRGAGIVAIGDTSTGIATLLGGSTDGNSVGAVGLVTFTYNALFNGTTWDRQRGAVTPVATTAVTSQLLKSSAGYFASASMIAGAAAGFFILYNSNSVPAGGAALTSSAILLAVPVAANGYATLGGDFKDKACSAGVVLLFSTSLANYTVPANAAVHMQGASY